MADKIKSFLKVSKDTYIRKLTLCDHTYSFLYLWWFIINFVGFLFGNFKFFQLFTFIPFMIKKLFFITLLQCGISMTILDLIIRYLFTSISKNQNGDFSRPNPFEFWHLKNLVMNIEIFLPIYIFSKLTFTLEKTTIASALIIGMIFIVRTLELFITGWNLKRLNEESVSCAYLELSEWNIKSNSTDTFGDTLEKFRFSKPYFLDKCFIQKIDRGIICPYWIYINYLKKANGENTKIIISAEKNSILNLDKKQIQDVLNIIDQCIVRNQPVIVLYKKSLFDYTGNKIFNGGDAKITEFLQQVLKRPVQFISGGEIKADVVKDFIMKDNEKNYDTELILNYRKYIEIFESTEKYQFLKEEITKIDSSVDEVASFYRLIKMAEYMFHYRALALVAKGHAEIKLNGKDRFESSMGLWKDIQNISTTIIKSDEVINAYGLIDGVMNKSGGNKRSIGYNEICNLLVQLRNRYIGHGTMAFSVSPQLLSALMQIVLVVLEEFLEDELEILQTDVIPSSVLGEEVPYLFIGLDNNEVDYVILLSGFIKGEEPSVEYIDYNRGILMSTSQVVYDLSYKFD